MSHESMGESFKVYFKKLKLYFQAVKKIFGFMSITLYSVLIALMILLIDQIDLIHNYYRKFGNLSITVILISIIIVITILDKVDFIGYSKLKNINFIDYILIISIISIIAHALIINIYLVSGLLDNIKLDLFILFILILSIGLLLKRINNYNFHDILYKKSLSLKDIYNNNFKFEDQMLINERDVDYDLLNRGTLINNVYKTIIDYKLEAGFTIGLFGKWGAGKTTILNNVKKRLIEDEKNSIVIIDNFDPWEYKKDSEIFINMLNTLLINIRNGYSSITTQRMIKTIANIVLGEKRNRFQFFNNNSNIGDLKQYKSKINRYIKESGKKYVFFIDNVDRLEKENILFLFQVISRILDFNRVIYVLSYDKENIEKIYKSTEQYNENFLKKIIQMEFQLPKVDKNVKREILLKSFTNIINKSHNVKENQYTPIIRIMTNELDLRDFKIYINSTMIVLLSEDFHLNIIDFLSIELIRIFNFKLYNEIKEMRRYFVSKGLTSIEQSIFFDTKELVEKKDKYFNSIFTEKNDNYAIFLANLFPNVRDFIKNSDGYDILYPEPVYDEEGIPIYNGKYFEYYFSFVENMYIKTNKKVKKTISFINKIEHFHLQKNYFKEFYNSMSNEYQLEFMVIFEDMISSVEEKKLSYAIRFLIESLPSINSKRKYMSSNAKNRLHIVVWKLMNRMDDESFQVLLNSVFDKRYDLILDIDMIKHWFTDVEGVNTGEKKSLLIDFAENMAIDIIKKDINLYSGEYYTASNIWGLKRLLKDEIKFKEYINKLINEENVYKILFDITRLAIGEKYRYYISKEYLEIFSSMEEINNIIDNVEPEGDELFIDKLYSEFRNDKENNKPEYERGIPLPYQKEINL